MEIPVLSTGLDEKIKNRIKSDLSTDKYLNIFYGTEFFIEDNSKEFSRILDKDFNISYITETISKAKNNELNYRHLDYYLIKSINRYISDLVLIEEHEKSQIQNQLLKRLSTVFSFHKNDDFKFSELVLKEIYNKQKLIRDTTYQLLPIKMKDLYIDSYIFLTKELTPNTIGATSCYGQLELKNNNDIQHLDKQDFALIVYLVLVSNNYSFRKSTTTRSADSDLPTLEKLFDNIHSSDKKGISQTLINLRIEDPDKRNIIGSLTNLINLDLHYNISSTNYKRYFFPTQLFGLKEGKLSEQRKKVITTLLTKLGLTNEEFNSSPEDYLSKSIAS